MSQLSIKFGLVSLLAHASQVHGALTCIGNDYLTKGDFALSPLGPSDEISIFNEEGVNQMGEMRYKTRADDMCYPDGATEMFALAGVNQENGFKFEFEMMVKSFTLEMRDFGDWNPNQMTGGKVIAIAKKEEEIVVQDVVHWQGNTERGGDACSASLDNLIKTGKSKFQFEAEEFNTVEIRFNSTKGGDVIHELLDPNTAWGNVCYEAAEPNKANDTTIADTSYNNVDGGAGNEVVDKSSPYLTPYETMDHEGTESISDQAHDQDKSSPYYTTNEAVALHVPEPEPVNADEEEPLPCASSTTYEDSADGNIAHEGTESISDQAYDKTSYADDKADTETTYLKTGSSSTLALSIFVSGIAILAMLQ